MSILRKAEQNKSLSNYSTFGIGGPARYFIEAHSVQQLQEALQACWIEQMPYFILGKGSNCLFDDRGFDGFVILNKINSMQLQGDLVEVGSGYSFSLLGTQTARQGLSGLEFASGIPGTVGGAVFMNAGANQTETCNCLEEVTFIEETGEIETYKKDQLVFQYRFSSFQEKRGAIAAAKFKLISAVDARGKQLKIIDYRLKTQPYTDKSAGCVFRNPSGNSAGALIQQCGLKGVSIGGAEVSVVHANFIVNNGNATAAQVWELAELVRKTVQEKTGVLLETEIRRVPYQSSILYG